MSAGREVGEIGLGGTYGETEAKPPKPSKRRQRWIDSLGVIAVLALVSVGYWAFIQRNVASPAAQLILGAFIIAALSVIFHAITLPGGFGVRRDVHDLRRTVEGGLAEVRQNLVQISSQVVSNTTNVHLITGAPARSELAEEPKAAATEPAGGARRAGAPKGPASFETSALKALQRLPALAGYDFVFEPRLGDARSRTAVIADAVAVGDDRALVVEVKMGRDAARNAYRQLMHFLPLVRLSPPSYGLFASKVLGLAVVPEGVAGGPEEFPGTFVLRFDGDEFSNAAAFERWLQNQ